MFNTIYRKKYDFELFTTKYTIEKNLLIKRANQYINNLISFTHPWDMEQNTKLTKFYGDWNMNPYNDMEWTWMLNRHRFIEELGISYYLTKDIKYFYSFKEYIMDWINKNSNPQENLITSWRRIDTGIRITHWIKAIEYFTDCDEFTNDFKDKIKEILYIHGDFLVKGYSNTSLTSNWGVLEFYGLFTLSLFYNYPEYKEWYQLSINILIEILDTQILDDGIQWERSPMYHNELCFSYLNIINITRNHNISLPKKSYKIIENMILANIKWMKPNHHQPLWGDSDDTNIQDLLSLAAILFNNSTFKALGSTELNLENYLLIGEPLATQYMQIDSQYPHFTSINFPNTGFLVFRDSWDINSSYLNFNTKNFGGGHAHDDLLHFSFYANKKDYLIDCGRYTYTESPERQYLKSSFGHNTIIVNNIESSIYNDSWTNLTEACYLEGAWVHQNNIDWGFSYNTSYLNLKVLITRNIIKFNSKSFLILDIIQTNSLNNIELKFNTPLNIIQKENYYYIDDLLFIPDSSANTEISESYYSPHYDQKYPSLQIRQNIQINQNHTISNLFSFQNSIIENLILVDRKNRKIDKTKAIAYKITIGIEVYILIYKIEPSAQNPGFFIEFNGKCYIHSKILLQQKNDSEYIELIKYI